MCFLQYVQQDIANLEKIPRKALCIESHCGVVVWVLDYNLGTAGSSSSSAMEAYWVTLGQLFTFSLTPQGCCEEKIEKWRMMKAILGPHLVKGRV